MLRRPSRDGNRDTIGVILTCSLLQHKLYFPVWTIGDRVHYRTNLRFPKAPCWIRVVIDVGGQFMTSSRGNQCTGNIYEQVDILNRDFRLPEDWKETALGIRFDGSDLRHGPYLELSPCQPPRKGQTLYIFEEFCRKLFLRAAKRGMTASDGRYDIETEKKKGSFQGPIKLIQEPRLVPWIRLIPRGEEIPKRSPSPAQEPIPSLPKPEAVGEAVAGILRPSFEEISRKIESTISSEKSSLAGILESSVETVVEKIESSSPSIASLLLGHLREELLPAQRVLKLELKLQEEKDDIKKVKEEVESEKGRLREIRAAKEVLIKECVSMFRALSHPGQDYKPGETIGESLELSEEERWVLRILEKNNRVAEQPCYSERFKHELYGWISSISTALRYMQGIEACLQSQAQNGVPKEQFFNDCDRFGLPLLPFPEKKYDRPFETLFHWLWFEVEWFKEGNWIDQVKRWCQPKNVDEYGLLRAHAIERVLYNGKDLIRARHLIQLCLLPEPRSFRWTDIYLRLAAIEDIMRGAWGALGIIVHTAPIGRPWWLKDTDPQFETGLLSDLNDYPEVQRVLRQEVERSGQPVIVIDIQKLGYDLVEQNSVGAVKTILRPAQYRSG